MSNSTPINWEHWRLGDVGEWIGGGTPSSSNAEFWDGNIPWVSPKDMKVANITSAQDRITVAAVRSSAVKLISAGSVLFVTRSGILAHSFPVATTKVEVTVNQDLKAITPVEVVDHEYLAWLLRAFERQILATCSKHGTTVHSIEIPALKDLLVPIPPPAEQRRIVKKLEELLSELDKGVESLLRARLQLVLYKAVILNGATQDHSGAAFPTRPLTELIGPINQGWSPKCELNREPNDAEWAIIKTTAVQPMRYDGMQCKPLPQGLVPRPNIEIHDDDLLMTRKGPRPRTGVVCHVRKARPRSMLCDTVYRFRCNDDLILPQYLELALNSPRLVQEINSRKAGISESGISLNHGKLASIPVPVPPNKDHQRSVVLRAQERLSIIDNAEVVIAQQIRHAEALRQAIYQRAFRGDLVAQEPGEEPASLLLERSSVEQKNGDDGGGRKRNNKNNSKKEAA